MSWGGARKGAGRPARGPVPSEPHKRRPQLAARHPVHVIARLVARTKHHGRSHKPAAQVVRPVPPPRGDASVARSEHRHGTDTSVARPERDGMDTSFARSDLYRALRRALAVSLARADFRIVHLAVRHDRVELVVEADDKLALARGMQGFQVSAAKSLNRLARRRGAVFRDRYRMRILRTRLEVRDVVGRLPLMRREAWPQTWLLRIELSRAATPRCVARRSPRAPPR